MFYENKTLTKIFEFYSIELEASTKCIYDRELPHSQITEQSMAPGGRDTGTCRDPESESFVRGGPTMTTLFWREDPNNAKSEP